MTSKGVKIAESKLMTTFLQECAQSAECATVKLGALKGFPASTKDPAVVEKAIVLLKQRADEMDIGVKQLKARQRIRDLEYGAECLRQTAGDTDAMKWFLKRGAEWCEENFIEYGTLRDSGVPAALLKKAGVER